MANQPKQLFVINNTEGTVTFFIAPGQANGPGAAMRNTDLRLFGLGHTMWGEGVDENFYKLTENFACPEKATSPGNPQDESDLGLGNGINNPINGQLWFNTTQKRLFVFDALLPGWKLVGAVVSGPSPPINPQQGDLWYDTTIPQLKVFDGVQFTSVADRYVLKSGDTMTGFLTLSGDPINPLHAATKQYAVARAGDTMTGFLTLNADPINPLHAATKQYVDVTAQPKDPDLTDIAGLTGTGILVRIAPDTWALRTITTNATLTVTNGSGVLGNPLLGITSIVQGTAGAFNKFLVNSFGQVTSNTPVTVTDIATLVDSRYVNVTGDSMTNFLTLHANPVNPFHAATKSYVDASVPSVSGCLCGTLINVTGSRAPNTTFTNTFGKDILCIVTFSSVIDGVRVNGVLIAGSFPLSVGTAGGNIVTFVVDAGKTYEVIAISGFTTLTHWYEYR